MSNLYNPRQVVLVTSRAEVRILGKETEKDDIITVTWHTPVSKEPELYAISIGNTRFSKKLIDKSKCFAVNFIPFDLKEAAVVCGTKTGEHLDKFREANLTMEEADSIDCGRLKEAVGYIECEVINEINAGDHTIYIGKIVSSSLKKDKERLLQGGADFTTTRY
ncbi:MAG TPA: flavin reductase family protein [Candidatus Nanoarchaeia archaeon]|nr:flavin reductase family protein [Candidatus Nanoarchaeia archaeon]